MYMGSIKACNVRCILAYKHQNKEIYTRNAVKLSSILMCIDRILNYVLKSADGIKF